MATDLSNLGFDTTKVKDLGDGFKVFPPGVYPVVIVDSEMVETKNKEGWMLSLTYQFIEGPHVGETLKDTFNVKNKSEKAQDIAWSNLNQICKAVGFSGQLGQIEKQIYGKPFSVKVDIVPSDKINPKTGKPFDNNNVSKRMPREAVSLGVVPPPAAIQPPVAGAPPPATRPWG